MSKKRRMAIETKRGKAIKSSDNEYRWTVVIEEIDGSVVTKEANGHSLEEALSRVQIIERTKSITKFIEKLPEWLLYVAIFSIMGGGALMSEFFNSASWISGAMGLLLVTGGVGYFLNRWTDKWTKNNEDAN